MPPHSERSRPQQRRYSTRVGSALQVEMLDEVTRAAWQDARELKKAAAKRPRRRKKATQ